MNIDKLQEQVNKSYDKYQSWEWVNIQKEMEEDENSPSIMDDFKK